MSDSKIYHEGSRHLQDRFDTRRIADRLEKVDLLEEFTGEHRAIIEAAPIPDWKRNPLYRDALPERDLRALADAEERSNLD